ncbi:hypothetical protein XaCFBP7622_10525 [Xanthomonas arboricola]|nr:hypothetical protein XaCFBP7622_10525 [Xanthomonas arboricola]
MGNRESGIGKRETGNGKRESGIGNRESAVVAHRLGAIGGLEELRCWMVLWPPLQRSERGCHAGV